MIHALCRRSHFVLRDGAQWNFDAIRRPHINVLQRSGPRLEARIDLHHDVILVQRFVHRRHLPLPQRVIQGVIHHRRREPQARRGVAVVDQVRLQAAVLQVGVGIAQFRKRQQLFQNDACPFLRFLRRVGLNAVLELRIAGAAADADVLGRLKEELRARDLCQLGAQPRNHLVRADLALFERFQLNVEVAAAPKPPADAPDVLHGRDRPARCSKTR